MKRLIFVRHGKSSWDHDVTDIDRPLQKRAYDDAKHVITAFKAHLDYNPKVFSSPAKRAATTANLFKAGLNIKEDHFQFESALYTFNAEEVMQFIIGLSDELTDVMLFGHNPAYTTLVNQLGSLPIDNLPTTGLVAIVFETDSWKSIGKGDTQLFLFPKNLR